MNREEVLIQTETVRVRVMALSPGEATPWHFHREVSDHFVGLSGVIQVRCQPPGEPVELLAGQRCSMDPGRVHQVANGSTTHPATYLLIQGVGRYDFNPVDTDCEGREPG